MLTSKKSIKLSPLPFRAAAHPNRYLFNDYADSKIIISVYPSTSSGTG